MNLIAAAVVIVVLVLIWAYRAGYFTQAPPAKSSFYNQSDCNYDGLGYQYGRLITPVDSDESFNSGLGQCMPSYTPDGTLINMHTTS